MKASRGGLLVRTRYPNSNRPDGNMWLVLSRLGPLRSGIWSYRLSMTSAPIAGGARTRMPHRCTRENSASDQRIRFCRLSGPFQRRFYDFHPLLKRLSGPLSQAVARRSVISMGSAAVPVKPALVGHACERHVEFANHKRGPRGEIRSSWKSRIILHMDNRREGPSLARSSALF